MAFVTVASTGPDLADLIDDARRRLEHAGSSVGRRAGDAGREAILTSARRNWGSLTVSGMRARLDVDTRGRSQSGSADVSLTAQPAGAWSVVEDGTSAHPIVARPGSGLPTRYGVFARVRHPGSEGSGAWTRAEGDVDSDVADIIETVYDEAMEV